MLSPLIKREIFKEAKRCHYQVPSDYEKILEKAQKVNTISDDGISYNGIKFHVSLFFFAILNCIKNNLLKYQKFFNLIHIKKR